ncbi:TPA: 2,3-bisphosphoglycerate-independent phosphoglycerate mutase [Candidatus Uhrbacteria bacterium]|nr:2,3-bisphosphoglycerate-independent phosphoglycerate mutase [Candidatus Uhrbacteria bacterium]
MRPKPAVLLILDGFGIAPDDQGNAITQAHTPVIDSLVATYPAMPIRASGEAVGLVWGSMGNSEVGHLTMGAGRVYYQSLPRIDRAIETGDFFENPALLNIMDAVKKTDGTLHIIGLLSEGGVHAHSRHCYAMLELAKKQGLKQVAVHVILDGRDALYNSGYHAVELLQEKVVEIGIGEIASVSGRFYSMDRDNRWDRTEKAYRAIVEGVGVESTDPLLAMKESYTKEIYDEEFIPTVITKDGKPVAMIQEGDAVFVSNFRPDRARQLTRALVLPTFDGFPREYKNNVIVTTMTEYEKGLPVGVVYPPEVITKGLSEILSNTGMKQLHIAETEKYAHVTFFFNGTRENPFPGEDRVVIPSPRVASYDEVPEMSAVGITDRIVKEVKAGTYDVIIANYANADMVGHTGNFEATKTAVEVVDTAVGRIVEAVLAKNGVVLITADHGNAEEMSNLTTAQMDKEHSTNPIPFIIVGNAFAGQPSVVGDVPNNDLSLVSPVGMIADVAPTLLHILGIPKPQSMTGESLIV